MRTYSSRRYYAFDICPGYWGALIAHHKGGRVCSIDHVQNELVGLGDALSQWAQGLSGSFFTATSAVANEFGGIMTWVQAQAQYQPSAKADFARRADGWLVAYAKAQGLTVVTHEVANPAIQRKVPIPNVCIAFGVKWIDTFDMLRALGVSFR